MPVNSICNRNLAGYKNIFPIGLGAMPLSLVGRPSEKKALEIVINFFENGGNFIDTADVYGIDDADRGHNEKLIAKAVKQFAKSENILIATKGGASRPNGGWALGGGKPNLLRKTCERSLKNLEIEAHALYYLHGPDHQVALEDSLGELIKLKDEGKILHLGIANVDLAQLKLACSLTSLAAVQNRCNPFCKEDLNNGLIEFCNSQSIAYVAYCPLGGWADHEKLAQHEDFKNLALKYETTTYVLALAWLLRKGNHILPIPGMDKTQQIAANFEALSIDLSESDIGLIDNFPNLYAAKHVDVV